METQKPKRCTRCEKLLNEEEIGSGNELCGICLRRQNGESY